MRIEIDRVSKRYGARTVVQDVSLDVRDGELLALLGPSGSGKSTLLFMLAGLVAPDSGAIRFDGRPAPDCPRDRRIGMVFQDLALWPHMTVEEHLRFVAPGDDPGILLDLVELRKLAKARPNTLSGGEAQRLALARALAGNPKLLLLDEPFGSLDRALQERALDLVADLHRRFNLATILVTHNYEEAFRIADRVAVLVDGRAIQTGTPAEVYQSPASERVALLTGPVSTWEGAWVRPEQLQATPDENSDSIAQACRFRGGRWLVTVGSALIDSPTPIAPGTRIRVSRLR